MSQNKLVCELNNQKLAEGRFQISLLLTLISTYRNACPNITVNFFHHSYFWFHPMEMLITHVLDNDESSVISTIGLFSKALSKIQLGEEKKN